MTKLQSLRLGAGLVLIAGCIDGSREPITSPSTTTSPSVAIGAASIHGDTPEDAKGKFHRTNHADWVGKAHNKALDEFFAKMIADKGTPQDFCARLLEFTSHPARLPAGMVQGTREQRRAAALSGLSRTGACSSRLTGDASSVTWPLGLFSAANFGATLDSVSDAADYLLDKIANAQVQAMNAEDLATALTPILGEADQLVSEERELVYATASITQSSYEYWLANITPQSEQVDVTYGPCLGQYTDQSYALDTCIGITSGITQTGYDKAGMTGRIIFASSTQSGCADYLNRGTIGADDLKGAAGGAFNGFRTGGLQGILPGAVFGGAYASAASSWWMFAKWAHCRRAGGSGPGTKPELM